MNIELKNVRTFEGIDCGGFTAELYRDGVHVATASNYGDGGETNYDMADGQDDSVLAEIDAWTRSTCAPIPSQVGGTLEVTIGLYVDALVTLDDLRRWMNRKAGKYIVGITPDGRVVTWNRQDKKRPQPADWQAVQQRNPEHTILNGMDRKDAAFALYRATQPADAVQL